MNKLAAMNAFLSGSIALGFAIIAVSFQRFWRRTRIRLFNLFAVAFLILAMERVVEGTNAGIETSPQLYVLRLVAFMIIIAAVVNHNRIRPR